MSRTARSAAATRGRIGLPPPAATLCLRRPERQIDDSETTVVGTLAGTGNAPGTDLPARAGCRGEAVGTFGDRCSVPAVVLLVIVTAAVGSGLLGWDVGSLAGAPRGRGQGLRVRRRRAGDDDDGAGARRGSAGGGRRAGSQDAGRGAGQRVHERRGRSGGWGRAWSGRWAGRRPSCR